MITIPLFLQGLLQFSLEEENLLKFASYAEDFVQSLEMILSQGQKFSDLRVVILGVGKTGCGIS